MRLNDYVARLEVAMQKARAMQLIERRRQLRSNGQRLLRGKRAAARETRCERNASHPFAKDPRHAPGFTGREWRERTPGG